MIDWDSPDWGQGHVTESDTGSWLEAESND